MLGCGRYKPASIFLRGVRTNNNDISYENSIGRREKMQREVYDLVPQWAKEDGDYSLMVGDDIDSLATGALLKKVKGYDVNWFYDFNNVYVADKEDKRERIGCDMALERGKVFDNHVTLLDPNGYRNPESVNLNVMYGVNRENYTDKYAGSTLLLAWSFYGLPLPESEEGQMILLAIDSAYKGHYNNGFKAIHNRWLRKLGFEELINTLNWSIEEDFIDVIKEFGLSESIKIKKGQLQTSIDLESVGRHLGVEIELPTQEFSKLWTLKRDNIKDLRKIDSSQPMKKSRKVYSFALTYKHGAEFTML